MDLLGQKVPSLLDSIVTLICEGYFIKNIMPLLNKSTGELAKAHSLFWLSAMNNEVMPVSKYFEADVILLGFRIPWVRFLVLKDSNVLLEPSTALNYQGSLGVTCSGLGARSLGGHMDLLPLRNYVV